MIHFLSNLRFPMRFLISCLLSFLFVLPLQSQAQTMTDKLLQHLLNKQMPKVLYRINNKPFQYGVYDVVVHKIASPNISSTSTQITNHLPMRIEFLATVKQSILGQQLSFNCKTQFATVNKWVITPDLATGKVDIKMHVPIPDSTLNCEGLSLPITSVLEKMVREQKPKWEQDAKQKIEAALTDIGLKQ